MKLLFQLSTLIGLFLLFQGCGSDTKKETSSVSLTKVVEGKSTLSTISSQKSHATICFDKNKNEQCDSDEERTETDINGNYRLELANGIEEGDILIAFGGQSILPPNNFNHLVFGKVFHLSEKEQNINILSSLIANEISNGLTYEEAVAKIAKHYELEPTTILSNPLDNATHILGEGKRYLKVSSSLEIIINERIKGASKKQEKFFDDVLDFVGLSDENATDTNTTESNQTSFLPSLEEVDNTINEYAEIFDNFFETLSDFYNGVIAFFIPEDINETAESNLSFEGFGFQEVPLTREELTGTWYFKEDSGKKSCVYISEFNNVSSFDSDGNITTSRLSVEYKDANETDVSAIEFNYTLFSSDRILISEFRALHVFKGLDSENSQGIVGSKMITLKFCKENVLGLN